MEMQVLSVHEQTLQTATTSFPDQFEFEES